MNRRSLLALAFTLICTASFLMFDFAAAQTTSGSSGGGSTSASTTPSGDQGQSYQHLKPPPSPPKSSGGGGGQQPCPSPYGGSKASNTADENIARDSNALCHTSGSANYFKGISPGGSCKMGPKTMKNLDKLNCDAPGGIKGKCSAQTHTCKATNPSGKPNPSGIGGPRQATSTASTTEMSDSSSGSDGSFDDASSTTTPDSSQADSDTESTDSSASENADTADSGSQTDTTQGNTNTNANAPINWTGLSTWNGWNGASASTPGKANQGNAVNNSNKASGPANTGESQTNNIKSNSPFQESVGFDQWGSIFSAPNDAQAAPSGGVVSNPGQYTASASFTDDSYLARHPIQPSALQRMYELIMSTISDTLHSL